MSVKYLDMTVRQWLQFREEERTRIDPETAEVHWSSEGVEDFHGINIAPEVIERIRYVHKWGPSEGYCFARNPSSEIWFGLEELPENILERLLAKRRASLYESFLDSPFNDDSSLTIRDWLEIRKQEGMRIDPETAEVDWSYAETFDPYGLGLELSDELRQVGREYFARNPGSDIWVVFQDLPEGTRNKLWEMHSSKLAFPAGLPVEWFGT
jgi:hypothetical protein